MYETETNDIVQTERCRRCLHKFKGEYDCSRCPSDDELYAPERAEVPGQTSMFDMLESEENSDG